MRVYTSGAIRALVIGAVIGTMAQAAFAQKSDKVESRAVDIWSDGTRMSGDVWKPKDLKEGDTLPAILLCHGWGGEKRHLNLTYAPRFAAEGYVVLTFDYRGWGDSDSRMVLVGDKPAELGENNEATVKVKMIRDLVDVFDQLEDIQAALYFLEGEPGVDKDRIGIWGSSMGGGLVVQTAIDDPRIKCVVSQVGAMGGVSSAERYMADKGGLEALHQRKIDRARGKLDPVPQGVDEFPGLRGTPYIEKFPQYDPASEADKLSVPTLLIDAEKEELFDIKEHSQRVYDAIKDKKDVPSKYHIEPGITHYGIYQAKYQVGVDMALEWYGNYLKK